MSKPDRAALLALLGPATAGAGLDLEDVEVTPAGRRRLVRVVVDRDGGVSLDDVAAASSAVSAALDDSDALGSTPYVLEVTSPGVDRPLTEARHWRRARGRLVSVALAGGGEVTGRVLDAGEEDVSLDVDGTVRTLGWAEVARGRVQVEFSRGAGAGPAGDGPDEDAPDEDAPDEDAPDEGGEG